MASGPKIGVLTFHRSINYGSYWQARQLVEGLRGRGCEAELLDHACDCVGRAELKCALQPKLPTRTPRAYLKSYADKARRLANAVAELPLSQSFSMHEPHRAGDYDAIVIGSDEVWNFRHPWFGSKPIFFGEQLKARRLVAYGASFGNHNASDGIDPHWARKLDRFNAISVRDENSRHLIMGSTDREPTLVLDPCLQFPQPSLAQRQGDYAVVYGHGFPAWLEHYVQRWADRRNIRLVSIGYVNEWAHEQRVSAGPVEFAELIASAGAVITNFFHGCVFALLNGKPWVSAPSAYRSIKIHDLVSVLGAQSRLVDERVSEKVFDELLENPVEASVAIRIDELRDRSNEYLDAALS